MIKTAKPMLFTAGKMASRLGVQNWQIAKLANAGKIPFVKAGAYRIFSETDEPAISMALIEAGYLTAEK